MSSVLIKGVEKPKRCVDCPIAFAGLCSLRLDKGRYPLYNTPEWCPMIEIKEPHGKLIDAEVLNDKMYHEAFEKDSELQKWESGCWIRYKLFENCINDAPAVIEEER